MGAILLASLVVAGGQQGQRDDGTDPNEPSGEGIYNAHGCSGCHGENGEGGVGPAFAGNPKLWNEEYVIDQILLGGGGMPGFHRQLTDGQVAAVATLVRTSWGNDLEPLDGDEVRRRRSSLEQRQAEASGSQIYAWNCMICHGVEGRGGVGPALAANPHLADTSYIVAQIQLGGGGMPPFGPILESAEIASVASYIREAWENEFGPVPVEHVRVQWEGLGRAPTAAGSQEASQQGEQSPESGQVSAGGEELYMQMGCAGCHSAEGAGGIGPALQGNPGLADGHYVLTTIRDGRKGMPAFGHLIEQRQLVTLANYVRSAWGNDFGRVAFEVVRDLPPTLRRRQTDPARQRPLDEAGSELFGLVGCAGCHSAEGAGGIGPALKGNPALENARYVVDTILTGGRQMEAYGDLLTDQQVAALATHVRTAWGNDFGEVEVDAVTDVRREVEEGRR